MQIFELHFNPKLKEEQIFDSFVYEPENIYEKKLGSLYIVGELQNTFPQNLKFLDNLAKVIKKNYYTLSPKSPEKALFQSSKKANEFLDQEIKKENVSWLGNLNFAILSLKTKNHFLNNGSAGFDLTFTKTGDLKILLLRGGQLINIGKNLERRGIEPYPVKVFLNIASGKLIQDDVIMVCTKSVFDFFQQQNLLAKITQVSNQNGIDSKKLKDILPSSLFTKGEGSKVSGICFLAAVKPESQSARQSKPLLFEKEERFSLSQTFSPLLKPIKAITNVFESHVRFLTKICKSKKLSSKISLPKLPKLKIPNFKNLLKIKLKETISLPKIKVPKIPNPSIEKFRHSKNIKKKLILILSLIFFLILGFLIFKQMGSKKEREIEISLNEIQKKVNQAENYLIFKEEEKANSLLKEAWGEILPLTEGETSLKSDALSLKQSIEKTLKELNNLEEIANPEVLTELNPEESDVEHKKTLYSFSGSGSLFSPPSTIFILKNGEWQEGNINLPDFDFNLDLFASYYSSLYFLDKETCKIIKYSSLGNSKWSSPKKWSESSEKNCSNPKSIAIDGSVWVLNEDNSITLYYKGVYQKTITFNFFPFEENITVIKTNANLSYLYLLEPVKKRVIITDKAGKIIKQFQSEKFDNLKDLSISEDGKTIWLLNDLKIYKINF